MSPGGGIPAFRPAVAEIDLGAIRHNARALAALARPARLLVVVKADGYGHGAVEVATAVVEAGVRWLGVALVEEGVALRTAGLDARVLVLSEPPSHAAASLVAHRITPVVYTLGFIETLARVVGESDREEPLPVHLKVDTGMHRVGCPPDEALALAKAVTARPELELEGLMTHFAVADEPGNDFTRVQMERFEQVRAELSAAGIEPRVVHASNSAALLTHAEARYDMVRCGIAVYGIPPSPGLAGIVDLRPAMCLRARVSYVREVGAGERVSYGLRYALGAPTRIATVPIGYADGVPRRLSAVGGAALVRGRRRPLAGTVTMDQLMVDCGDDPVSPGDEVVLIGRQGDEEITATEWAERLDTIAYEIVCGVGGRVPRVYAGRTPGP